MLYFGALFVVVVVNDKHVKKIESVSLPKLISKYGYNRKLALDIQGRSKELGGAGFCSFKNMIGAATVQHFKKNLRTSIEGIVKKKICITMV